MAQTIQIISVTRADGFGPVATPDGGANDLTGLLLPLLALEATSLDAPAGSGRLS